MEQLRVAENLMVQLWAEDEHKLLLGFAQSGEITVFSMQLSHAPNRVGDKIMQPSVRNWRIPRPEVDVGSQDFTARRIRQNSSSCLGKTDWPKTRSGWGFVFGNSMADQSSKLFHGWTLS